MKLWFDDIRRPPDDTWFWARTIEDAKLIVNSHDIQEASLDHDLGLHEYDPDEQDADLRRVPAQFKCYHCPALTWEKGLNTPPDQCSGCGADSGALSKVEVPDGVEFAKWLVETNQVPQTITIHTMNPVGAINIAKVLENHASITIRAYERW